MFSTIQVGKTIRQARMVKNMTQTALADELGVSYQAVSNWERGGSMPDIAKLPDLCRILGLSFEELMGTEEARIVRKAVEEPQAPLTLRELTEAAPILPPKKVTEDAKASAEEEGTPLRLADLVKLAPFLDEEYLDQLAMEAGVDQLEELVELAPFLSDEALDALAERFRGQVSSLNELTALAPFLSEEALDALLDGYSGPLKELTALAPFASDEALGRLVEKQLRGGDLDMDQLSGLLPFLDEDTLRSLADYLMEKRDLNALTKLSPFL